jgi:hypothetical protein
VTLTAVPDGNQANLAQIMTDRVVAAYAAITPSPGITDSAYVQFKPANQIDTATTRWDLNEPTLVMRPYVYMLDPFSSIRALNNPAVLAGIIKEITVPPLSLGLTRVNLTASLPPSRVGISALGARIDLPSKPPARPFSISKTTLFTPPNDSGAIDFTLGAEETIEYSVTTFAVIAAGSFVQEYQSTAQSRKDTWVQLAAGDFPLNFAHVVAGSRLLNLASIEGVLSYQVGTRTVQQPFKLSTSSSDIAVAAPTTAANSSIALQAVPLDGSAPLALPAMALGRIDLDVNSFAGYGAHTVTVQCHMNAGDAPLFIELISEIQAADSQAIPGKIALTADQPNSTWGYVATSPFHAGYCFRVAAATGNPPASWSTPRSSDTTLLLDQNGAVISDAAAVPPSVPPPGSPTTSATNSDSVPSLVS